MFYKLVLQLFITIDIITIRVHHHYLFITNIMLVYLNTFFYYLFFSFLIPFLILFISVFIMFHSVLFYISRRIHCWISSIWNFLYQHVQQLNIFKRSSNNSCQKLFFHSYFFRYLRIYNYIRIYCIFYKIRNNLISSKHKILMFLYL